VVEIISREVPVTEIERSVGPRPSARLVASVERHGVVVPVVLREMVSEDGELAYGIVDGNRRVAAAREASVDVVPARVITEATEADAAQVTLLTNSFRAGNYVTELWALRALERSGIDRRKLPEVTGMTASTIETREILSRLERRLFIGLAEGSISPTIALAAAKLDPEIQKGLGDTFSETGRLTKAQVDAVTPRAGQDEHDLPEIDTEGSVLPADLQIALSSVVRTAIQRGIDEETFIDAAHRAYRDGTSS
jgi:ParB-like chromosome segregation protein Spo0J